MQSDPVDDSEDDDEDDDQDDNEDDNAEDDEDGKDLEANLQDLSIEDKLDT